MPHWKPRPQLVHVILPATGVGIGDGVAIGPLREQAPMARMEAMRSAIVRGLTKGVYRAIRLSLRRRARRARCQRLTPPIAQLVDSQGGLMQLCPIEST